MPREFLITDSIVASVNLNAPTAIGNGSGSNPSFQDWVARLEAICTPREDDIKFFIGGAYNPVYPNNDDPDNGCSWTRTKKRAWKGVIVLQLVDQPAFRVRAEVKFAVAQDDSQAWLTVEYNPTTMAVGNNVHPSAFIDRATGLGSVFPSSDWNAMTWAFRVGFDFLEAMAGGPLFDDQTRRVIERGEIHLVSAQWAAAKPVEDISAFLQLTAVICGQTIARGKGIIDNAHHLGLTFTAFANPDPAEEGLSGIMLRKFHGNKPLWSVSHYDKRVRLDQMHQTAVVSAAETRTANQCVREDITAHSEGILVIVKAARAQLANMDAEERAFFDFLSPEELLQGEPRPTVWWLQRAIYILSHRRRNGAYVRYSFATWLVPYVEQNVLHFDVIAGITTAGFHALLALDDTIAVAWRSDPIPEADDWAGRFAKAAGCAKATVYNRREEWRRVYGIDISFPLALYRDILFFGHNSIAKPENITALMVAVQNEDGKEAVRLHAEALADFERKRIEIVNPALTSRPRALPLKPSSRISPVLADTDLELDDVDLIEVLAPTKALASPAGPTDVQASGKGPAGPVKHRGVDPANQLVVAVAPTTKQGRKLPTRSNSDHPLNSPKLGKRPPGRGR